MRRAPVVSLHSQSPLLDTSPLRPGLPIWKRSPRHLSRSSVSLERLPSAIATPHTQAPTPSESSTHHPTASLAARAQSRAACLTPPNSSPSQDGNYTSSSSVCARARREQAPTHRVGRRRQRRGLWSPHFYAKASAPYPLRTPSRPLLNRLLFSTLSSHHTVTTFSCAPGHAPGARTSRAHRPRRGPSFY